MPSPANSVTVPITETDAGDVSNDHNTIEVCVVKHNKKKNRTTEQALKMLLPLPT